MILDGKGKLARLGIDTLIPSSAKRRERTRVRNGGSTSTKFVMIKKPITYENQETALSLELAVIMSSVPSPFKSAAKAHRAPMAVLVTTTWSEAEKRALSSLAAVPVPGKLIRIVDHQTRPKSDTTIEEEDTMMCESSLCVCCGFVQIAE